MSTCKGHSIAIKIGKIRLIPSSLNEALEYPGDTLISLGQIATVQPVVTWQGNKEYQPDKLFIPAPNKLMIDWTDGGVPARCTRSWWEDLVQWMRDMDEGEVVMHCHGGHGRTGTALAIIMGLIQDDKKDGIDLSEAGKWVQENYCDHAIETKRQIKYIGKILGVKQKGIVIFKKPVLPKQGNNTYTVGQDAWSGWEEDEWPPVFRATPEEITLKRTFYSKKHEEHILNAKWARLEWMKLNKDDAKGTEYAKEEKEHASKAKNIKKRMSADDEETKAWEDFYSGANDTPPPDLDDRWVKDLEDMGWTQDEGGTWAQDDDKLSTSGM